MEKNMFIFNLAFWNKVSIVHNITTESYFYNNIVWLGMDCFWVQ